MPEDYLTPERHRARNGLIFLVAGFVLLLWVWGSWVYRTWPPGVMPTMASAEPVESGAEQGSLSTPLLLVVASIVLLLALTGGYVLAKRHSSRHGDLKEGKGRLSTSEEMSENRISRDDHS